MKPIQPLRQTLRQTLCQIPWPALWQNPSLALGISLLFSLGYSLLALKQGLAGPYVIQDDARQHVFWMQRFLEPGVFPGDLIADYFQSVAPWGYSQLYHWGAIAHVSPLLLSKLLPPILAVITTVYAFRLAQGIVPSPRYGPAVGLVATLLLNQNLGMQDGLVSGTPKAFLYPLLLAFLDYGVRGNLWGCGVTLVLQGLFYPLTLFLSLGVLGLRSLEWRRVDGSGSLRWSAPRQLRLCTVGGAIAIAILAIYAGQTSRYGPTISVAEARQLPEFLAGNRASFFHDDDPWRFWLNASRPSLRLAAAFVPLLNHAVLLWPLLWVWRQRLPPLGQLEEGIWILPQLLGSSLAWFLAAHALLFKLHLPSRYSQHSLRIIVAYGSAIALVAVLEALWTETLGAQTPGAQTPRAQTFWAGVGRWWSRGVAVVLVLLLGGYPGLVQGFPSTGYIVGRYPGLYRFLASQPQEIRVASLSAEVNNLPSFTGRSILAGDEYAVPYHVGYYRPFRARAEAILGAQYTANPAELRAMIREYGVTFWLVEAEDFSVERLRSDRWLRSFPKTTAMAIAQLEQGQAPVLAQRRSRCRVFVERDLELLDASCLAQE